MTGIANQYALAVFSLARNDKRHEEFLSILESFVNNMEEDTYKFFAHPKISKVNKKQTLEKVVNDKLLLNFLKVLIDNDRFDLIEAISLEYRNILDNLNQIMNVTIVSNKLLSKNNIDRIKNKLAEKYNRKILIENNIDESILGGFRVEFEENVIDETINKQLDDIKASLTE